MDILLMHRRGLSQRQIARKLGISRNTVKKYMENRDGH
ncbi:MAG: helix-turn-helix domain-containing protein [Thermodesulfobacteriota bacterium]|nr:helix-turn-helix domain-containing protein [Thermodesulfobacteriota bacterium]